MRRAGPAVIVILAIALLLSLIVPNFLTARNRSRQKRTMADMRTIATALEARATDMSSYAIVADAYNANPGKSVEKFATLHRESFSDLERALVPTYIKKLPRKDGWGVDFDIRTGHYVGNGKATTYALRSYGSDRRPDGDSYAGRTISTFREDIVYSDGSFFQYPEGVCTH
jgi:type II secretory pathway pseudopilin PulG